ncbi:hypothetical protein KGF57_004177, partial [Candida theae]
WGSELIDVYGGYKLDSYNILSPTLPFVVVAVHLERNIESRKYNHMDDKYKIRLGTYTAESAEGKRKLDVLFKRIYEDEELRKISKYFCLCNLQFI